MKIKVDIEATPEEIRTFLGLPDVQPMQKKVMEAISRRTLEGVEDYDAANLLKPFLSQGVQSLEAFQRAFWEAFNRREDSREPRASSSQRTPRGSNERDGKN